MADSSWIGCLVSRQPIGIDDKALGFIHEHGFFHLWIITMWITTQFLRQTKENSKLNNGGFNKWLEILAGKDLQTILRKSENVDFKRHSEGKHCQLETEAIQRPRICKEAATKYYSYAANETDEDGEHRLPMVKPKRGKFTVKIIFFDATIGSKNYTICKIDTRSIFATDWGQPISLFTVLQ